MGSAPYVLLAIATFAVIGAMFYLRTLATRAGLPQEKEHWMVFAVFSGMIAVSGVEKENVWVSLIGLLLAVSGIVYHASRFIAQVKVRRSR